MVGAVKKVGLGLLTKKGKNSAVPKGLETFPPCLPILPGKSLGPYKGGCCYHEYSAVGKLQDGGF